MEQKNDINQIDIPFDKRTNLSNPNSSLLKNSLILSPFLFLFFSLAALRLSRSIDIELGPLTNLNFQSQIKNEHRILGHLPYAEIPKEKLVLIEPNIDVHIDMRDSLLNMRDEAKKDGIYLVFLSGFRSINLQKVIFIL